MGILETVFGVVVIVLAAIAVIGALAVVIVAEWYAIRRTIERHRRPRPDSPPVSRYWREHAAIRLPEGRP